MADKLIEAGSNLTPESFLEAYREFQLARREQSEAGTKVARAGKKMKAIGINKLAFEIFEKLSQIETDEARACLKAVMRYGTWADRPYAIQQDLFHGMAIEVPKAEAKTEFAEFEVEDAGYKAGLNGERIDANPYSPQDADDARYTLWRRGWENGQAAAVHKAFGGKPKGERRTGRKGRRNTVAADLSSEDDGGSVH